MQVMEGCGVIDVYCGRLRGQGSGQDACEQFRQVNRESPWQRRGESSVGERETQLVGCGVGRDVLRVFHEPVVVVGG